MKPIMGLLIGMLMVLSGCQSSPNYDYDQSVDFDKVKTYAWLIRSSSTTDEQSYFQNDINHKRIIAAIENDLHSKGLIKVAPNNADTLVDFNTEVTIKQTQDPRHAQAVFWRFDPYYYNGIWGAKAHLNSHHQEYNQGTIVIDFMDNHQSLLWRGSAQTRLSNKSTPDNRRAKVHDMVTKILANFPPL